MTRSDLQRALVAAAVVAAVALSGCAAPAKPQTAEGPGKPFVPPEMRQRLADPGMYTLPDGRRLAVGVLHFRDTEGGYWGVFETRVPQQEATAVVVIANAERFRKLQPLDGQYVAVAGRLAEGASIRMAGPEMDADWVAFVSDLVGAEKTNAYGPGLHVLETGEVLAQGWLERDDGKLRLFSTPPTDTTRTEVARVTTDAASRFEESVVGQYVTMTGSTEGTSAGLPVFVVGRLGGSSPAAFGGGTLRTGTPYRWRHVEKAGVKDLPGGRKRVVGVLYIYEKAGLPGKSFSMALAMPFALSPFDAGATVEATGSVAEELRRLGQSAYVAVSGRIRESRLTVPSQPGPPEIVVVADGVSLVTSMTLEPGESYH